MSHSASQWWVTKVDHIEANDGELNIIFFEPSGSESDGNSFTYSNRPIRKEVNEKKYTSWRTIAMHCTQRENRQSRLWKDQRGQTMTLQQQIFCWAMMRWIIRKRKIFNFFTIENPSEILILTISQKNDYN
jgi:hypothetical protein